MSISVKEVVTELDRQRFLDETKEVERFMVTTEVTKMPITKEDFNKEPVISSITVGYVTKGEQYTEEHWYRIDESLVKSLKEFFETREFETYCGEFDYAALLAYGIKLNITYEWCTPKSFKFFRKTLDCGKDSIPAERKLQFCKSMKDMEPVPGEIAIEHGIGAYFGVRINEQAFKKYIDNLQNEKDKFEQLIKPKVGDIDIDSVIRLRDAINKKYGAHLIRGITKNELERVANQAPENTELVELTRNIIAYKTHRAEICHMESVSSKIINGYIPVGKVVGCIKSDMVDKLIQKGLVKPSDKYTILKVSTEAHAIYKMVYRLITTVNEPEDHFKFIASKVFEVPEDEVTHNQRFAVKWAIFGIMEPIAVINKAYSYASETGYSAEEILKKTEHVLLSISVSELSSNAWKTDLPTEVRFMLAECRNMYQVTRIVTKLWEALDAYIITLIRQHFGKNNMRVRMLSLCYDAMVYEVANGDIEDFKKCLEKCSISLINGKKIKIEIDKYIK